MTGSNRRHPPCKGGALPAELIARGFMLSRYFVRRPVPGLYRGGPGTGVLNDL